jgi:hypothetical protein
MKIEGKRRRRTSAHPILQAIVIAMAIPNNKCSAEESTFPQCLKRSDCTNFPVQAQGEANGDMVSGFYFVLSHLVK